MALPHAAVDLDFEALESFVVENNGLAELEAKIGRLNIFDALEITTKEIRHSNFLRWLLDPIESHGQGDLFLKAVLMDLLRRAPRPLRPFSPVVVDGTQLRGVSVRREWRQIDILVTCKDPPFVLAIENKIETSEHSDQLRRYEDDIALNFPEARPFFVFLSKDRTKASRDQWVAYGYADLYGALDRCRRANAASIGGDVQVFLEHYLSLIGTRFMEDQTIDGLCRQIWRTHRRALRLIFEKMGAPTAEVVAELEDLLKEQSERWHITHRYSANGGVEVGFVPKSWLDVFPPNSIKYDSADPRAWLRLGFWCGNRKNESVVAFWCYAYPTTDPSLRRKALERLTRDKNEFGLKTKSITEKYTKLYSVQITAWPETDEPEMSVIRTAAAKRLDEEWNRFAGVADVLRPLFVATSSA